MVACTVRLSILKGDRSGGKNKEGVARRSTKSGRTGRCWRTRIKDQLYSSALYGDVPPLYSPLGVGVGAVNDVEARD